MKYLHLLVARWSRREWLAVLVVALVGALLVGTALSIVSAGDQLSTLAGDFEANATVAHYDSPETARADAGSDAVVLLTATATNGDGDTRRVVGIPGSPAIDIGLPPPPAEPSTAAATGGEWRLHGDRTTAPITLSPGGDTGIVPPSWILVEADHLDAAGATGALLIERTAGPTGGQGSPLVGVLAFFVGGTTDMFGMLWSGVAIAGLVVAVTVSSIVRLLIIDRARTIRVVRATGAPPQKIRVLLAVRAALLTAAGLVFGYAIGVIVPNVAVNAAVFLGLPTTLSLQVTPAVAWLLCRILGVLTLVGGVSGYLAARGATVVPPARIGTHAPGVPDSRLERLPGIRRVLGRQTVLPPGTILPTAATLSTFAILVLLVASLGGAGASVSTGATTLSEPVSPHPIASQLPESYAGAIQGREVTASAEILLPSYVDGDPYLARGGDYESVAAVTGAQLTAGRAPSAIDEAVAGVEAADTLGLEPGETLTMGGSTKAAFTQVTVVGLYEAGGLDDHQVLVSLPTARHLSTVSRGEVNVIRTSRAIDAGRDPARPIVLDVDAPRYADPGRPISVTARLWNPRGERIERTVSVAVGDERGTRTVTIQPRERTSVTLEVASPDEGEHELVVGSVQRPVTVTDSPPLAVAVPDEVRPGATVRLRVRDGRGAAVGNGTIAVAGATVQLGSDGTAWVPMPETSGTHEVAVRSGDREQRESVQVIPGAPRALRADVTLAPPSATVYVRPRATVELWNPWNRTIDATAGIEGPGTNPVEQVTVAPGTERELTTRLPRRSPGEYAVRASVDGRVRATATYRVEGDDRLGAALASSGQSGSGGGIEDAVRYAIGNLSVLLAAIAGLSAVTVVGATGAVLSRAVRARRRRIGIYRATGASPRRIFWLVVVDAVRIGAVSSLLALGIGLGVTAALSSLGRLTAFGIALDPWPSPTLAIGLLAGTLGLTVLAAALATASILRSPVRALIPREG